MFVQYTYLTMKLSTNVCTVYLSQTLTVYFRPTLQVSALSPYLPYRCLVSLQTYLIIIIPTFSRLPYRCLLSLQTYLTYVYFPSRPTLHVYFLPRPTLQMSTFSLDITYRCLLSLQTCLTDVYFPFTVTLHKPNFSLYISQHVDIKCADQLYEHYGCVQLSHTQ